MKVLVNALPLRYGGGVTYLQHQMAALARVCPDIKLHTLLSPWAELEGLPGISETVRVRSVPARFAYEQFRLPMRGADVLYCPANFGPMMSRAPMVLTVHNAHYYRSGLALHDTKALRPPWKVKANHWAMRRADAIVAISYAQARDVVATVPGVATKVRVIHSGVPDWPAESRSVAGLPDRYVLALASTAAHKRVEDVIAGWASALDLTDEPASLVLVGPATSDQEARWRRVAGRHQARLAIHGQITDRARLKWIYENATAMVSMSALESFPLTPSEAGSVGCPIVLSDIPPHREVSLGHATFVPVGNTTELASAMVEGLSAWKPGSRPWKWPVTWDANARALLDVFAEVRG